MSEEDVSAGIETVVEEAHRATARLVVEVDQNVATEDEVLAVKLIRDRLVQQVGLAEMDEPRDR